MNNRTWYAHGVRMLWKSIITFYFNVIGYGKFGLGFGGGGVYLGVVASKLGHLYRSGMGLGVHTTSSLGGESFAVHACGLFGLHAMNSGLIKRYGKWSSWWK